MSDSGWEIELSRELYGINHYIRRNFIDIDDEGFLVIKLKGDRLRIVDLMKKYGLTNAYIRIIPVIRWIMDQVVKEFQVASTKYSYRGRLIPVYPLKVNAHPLVVRTIWEHGRKYNWGFEIGTLQELESVKDILHEENRVLVLDGFKTSEELESLKKLSEKGWRIIVTLESDREIELASKYIDVFELGLRIKLMAKTGSKWSLSTGFSSKFGMTLNHLLRVLKDYPFLRKTVTTIHVHGGSQIYDSKALAKVVQEAARLVEDLKDYGFENLKAVDLGGGLAYPYLDIRDAMPESPDYTISEYFNIVLNALSKTSLQPDLLFENGRIITSAHRIVVSKVLEVREYGAEESDESLDLDFIEKTSDLRELEKKLAEFREVMSKIEMRTGWDLRAKNIIESTKAKLTNIVTLKVAETVSKNEVSLADIVKYPLIFKIITSPSKRYIVAYSLFADIPDKVVVNQYFQVAPAQRLNEKPDVLASLSDLTCDSMGEFREFISYVRSSRDPKTIFANVDYRLLAVPGQKIKLGGIPLHLPSKGEDYYIVILDTGAYQDALSMKHNLISEPPEIIIDEVDGEIKIECYRCESKGYIR
ncbi:decarboxylase [Thermogladius sp. 4427co]|uniref:decarboxylase n=1 Tax=Thermogladius sp. 4427co TaxID=3450718 RepID=UPI003F7AC11B